MTPRLLCDAAKPGQLVAPRFAGNRNGKIRYLLPIDMRLGFCPN
jgi:hypothetical protein